MVEISSGAHLEFFDRFLAARKTIPLPKDTLKLAVIAPVLRP